MDNKMQIISNVASKATTTGVVTTIGTAGAAQLKTIWGYTVDEWTVIFGVGGLLVAILGMLITSTIRYLDYRDKRRFRRESRQKP